ncbi:hypothetical protein BC828DRAFT_348111 [Blastocladiella britannica]|nr:hypothetical protein BC828DRAFT_348111 [Blastocladiella britannica]
MSQVVDAGIAGLKNLGNSCYQNSVMQCLFGAVPLVRFFMGGEFRNHINRDNPMGHGGKVAQSFFKLVLDMKRNAGSSVAPVSFRDMLGDVAPHYATRDQHDSQEFLTFLLDSLHEDLKRPLDPGARLPPSDNDDLESIPDVAEAARIAWARYMVRNSSVISQIFQGQLRSELQCSTCGTRSVSYSTFSTLSVPVPGGARARAPVHLEDCLREFVRPQVLDGDNAWRCPRCKVARSAIKSMAITKFPSVLIVHLMRFSFDGPFRNKIDRLVEFPIRGLALQPTGRPTAAKYDLFAAGNHYGGLDGGHYTAIVRHGSDWHYFDDSRVSKCSESEIVTNAAYTLFYVCRGSPEAQVLGVESGHKL